MTENNKDKSESNTDVRQEDKGRPAFSRRDFMRCSLPVSAVLAAGGAAVETAASGPTKVGSRTLTDERRRLRYVPGTLGVSKLPTAFPDWLADECVDLRQDTALRLPRYVFPEEALLYDRGEEEFDPFIREFFVEGLDQSNDPATPDLFKKISDIVGYRYVRQAGDPLFHDFLEELMDMIRRLNVSKYWLRLVHLASKKSAIPFSQLPKIPLETPAGAMLDPANIKPPVNSKDPNDPHNVMLADAEKKLEVCARDLRIHIQQKFPRKENPEGGEVEEAFVDVVKSNDYIIAVRVVWGVPGHEGSVVCDDGSSPDPEIGGSSSSYIYISSPFSSTTP